jgi:hypothetical protein
MRLPHEPSHASNTDLYLILLAEVTVDARRPIRASRARMEVIDALEQPRVFDGTRRRRACHVRVVAARTDTEHPTQRPHRIVGLMRSHEFEGGAELVSCTNHSAAFFKISFSTFSFLFRRLRCAQEERDIPRKAAAYFARESE